MTDRLLLYQICDSNFPIGSFSHSFGFETYLQTEEIHDASTFEHWLKTYLASQIVTSDCLAICFSYEALAENNFARLIELTEILQAQSAPVEVREANQRMGRQFLKLCQSLVTDDRLMRYKEQLAAQKLAPHPAIIFALVGKITEIALDELLSLYLLNLATSLTQNAVRGVPLGQVKGQQLLYQLHPFIREWSQQCLTLGEDHFGAIAPGIEISQMKHQFLFARNFMT